MKTISIGDRNKERNRYLRCMVRLLLRGAQTENAHNTEEMEITDFDETAACRLLNCPVVSPQSNSRRKDAVAAERLAEANMTADFMKGVNGKASKQQMLISRELRHRSAVYTIRIAGGMPSGQMESVRCRVVSISGRRYIIRSGVNGAMSIIAHKKSKER